jgi:hypothetical protein
VIEPAFYEDNSMEESNERITALSDAGNPWSKQFWHLTNQARIIKRDQAEADRLARAAGHRDALSARLKTAK